MRGIITLFVVVLLASFLYGVGFVDFDEGAYLSKGVRLGDLCIGECQGPFFLDLSDELSSLGEIEELDSGGVLLAPPVPGPGPEEPTPPGPGGGSSCTFPDEWDWRDRHGKNWVTFVKDQNDPQTCNSCWAHAPLAALELLTNVYFNGQYNLDLAEQQLVSCAEYPNHPEVGGCANSPLDLAGMYMSGDGGVMQEYCFPYQADDTVSCTGYSCPLSEIVTTKPSSHTILSFRGYNEKTLKRLIIEKGGGVWVGPPNLGHGVQLIGFGKVKPGQFPGVSDRHDGTTYWIAKNSFGTGFHDGGYSPLIGSFKDIFVRRNPNTGNFFSTIAFFNYPVTQENKGTGQDVTPEINCVDLDHDGYCNWGISKDNPGTCPADLKCHPTKKDSNDDPDYDYNLETYGRLLGPFDSCYNSLPLECSWVETSYCNSEPGTKCCTPYELDDMANCNEDWYGYCKECTCEDSNFKCGTKGDGVQTVCGEEKYCGSCADDEICRLGIYNGRGGTRCAKVCAEGPIITPTPCAEHEDCGELQLCSVDGWCILLTNPEACIGDSCCDDGLACTVDECGIDGICTNEGFDDRCEDDGLFCTGAPTCNVDDGCFNPSEPVCTFCDEGGDKCTCTDNADCPGDQACDSRGGGIGHCVPRCGALNPCAAGSICLSGICYECGAGGPGCAGKCGESIVCGGATIDCGECPKCFLEKTKITLIDGTKKNIEDMVVGDRVISYDEETVTKKEGIVTQVFAHEDSSESYLEINSLKLTPNHPLWVNEEWKTAGEIEIGDVLLGEDGELEVVNHIKEVEGLFTTYNLEVEPYNNYFAEGILAHNKDLPCSSTGECCELFGLNCDDNGDNIIAPD